MQYSPHDFQEGFPPRVMGSETEYNVQHMPDEMNISEFLDDETYFREDGRDDGKELWLQNGARLYIDSGGLLEYATPEVLNARNLLEHERAGESVVRDVAEKMNYPHSQGLAYKRSGYDIPGQERVTAGHHENYATNLPEIPGLAEKSHHKLHSALQSYLSTRQIWAGAGMLRNGYFAVGQKMSTIDFTAMSKTTQEGYKPGYSIHSGKTLNRLEIRTADGNMMDWAILQRYAFTSLVLRMIEHGDFPDRLLIEPGTASRFFQYTNDNQRIRLNDAHILPATHQRMIAQAAIDFIADNPDVPDEEQSAAIEVYTACSQLESIGEDLAGAEEVSDRIDWAAKLTVMRRRGITNFTNLNSYALMTDLKWEDIAVDGLARQWSRGSKGSEIAAPAAIELARIMPPPTRAMARVALLEQYSPTVEDRSSFCMLAWSSVQVDGHYFALPDPYEPSYGEH